MKEQIRWTEEERVALTKETISSLANEYGAQAINIDLLKGLRASLYSRYLTQAQTNVLPAYRSRNTKQDINAPWLVDYILKEISEHGTTPVIVEEQKPVKQFMEQTMSEALIANITEIKHDLIKLLLPEMIAELEKEYVLIPKSMTVKQAPVVAPSVDIKVKKTKVFIYGPQPAQQNEILSVFGSKFDITFEHDKVNIARRLIGFDYAVGMTDFMSHSADGVLSSALGCRYIRVVGGVTSIKKALSDLWSKVNLSK